MASLSFILLVSILYFLAKLNLHIEVIFLLKTNAVIVISAVRWSKNSFKVKIEVKSAKWTHDSSDMNKLKRFCMLKTINKYYINYIVHFVEVIND